MRGEEILFRFTAHNKKALQHKKSTSLMWIGKIDIIVAGGEELGERIGESRRVVGDFGKMLA